MTHTKERAAEMYGDDGIQKCPNCEGWHSIHSPALCFGCATGLAQSGRSRGHHPAL